MYVAQELGNLDFAFTNNASGSEATKMEIGLLGSAKFRITSDGMVDLVGASYTAGDPATTGYFQIKIAGTTYKVPVLAA